MAYSAANFNRAPHGTARVHAYKTTDAIATVIADDYFADEADFLTVGDMILVASSTGGVIATDLLVVSKVVGSDPGPAEVDTTNGT